MNARSVGLLVTCVLVMALATLSGLSLEGSRGAFILWQLRLPRVLVGVMVGSTLSLSGAVFQTVFANPLATPSTVGTMAGATLGALAGLVFAPATDFVGLSLVVLCAFAGALAASLLVASIAAARRAQISDVLLAGIAVTLAASALASGIQYVSDSRTLFAAAQWSLGQLPQVGYRGVALLAPFVAVSAFGLLALQRGLQAFVVGEELAHTQGVHVPRLRVLALSFAALGVAACVAWCGPIAFVGLIVPHIVRLVVGPSLRKLLPLSLVSGAAFLVGCDFVARSIVPNRELPVGIITAALGAPALMLLILRVRRLA